MRRGSPRQSFAGGVFMALRRTPVVCYNILVRRIGICESLI